MGPKDIIGVFTADTHIIENTWASRPSISHDSFFGFSQVVDLAIRCRAPLYVAGDTIELMRPGTPSSETVKFIRGRLEDLYDAGQTLSFIRGQHCMSNPHWFTAIDPRTCYVDQEVFDVGPFKFFGLSFREPEELRQMIATAPKDIDGWFMHQNWCDLSEDVHGSGQGWLKDLTHGRWVFTGDLHDNVVKRIGELMVISPGSTHKRTLREPDEHYCMVLRRDGTWAKFPLKSRAVVRLIARSVLQWEEDLALLRSEIEALIERCISEKKYPSRISTPILLVEDRCRCNASVSAKEVLGDIAHVINATGVKDSEVPVSIEASTEMMVQEPIRLSAEGLRSMATASLNTVDDRDVRWAIERWLVGVPLSQVRNEFFAKKGSSSDLTST